MGKLYVYLLLLVTWYAQGQNITKVEYFIDTDPGYGVATDVPVTASPTITNFTFTVPIASVTDGFHTLFIRSRNANNKWSPVIGRPFVKLTLATTQPNLNRIEYFIDADPGYGSGTSVSFTAGTQVTGLNFTVPLTSLTNGFHTLYIRSRDANNKWSTIQTRPFVKLDLNAALPNITRVEYFVDTDPGYGSATSVTITPGSSITDLNLSIDVSSLSQGAHKLFVRAKDANNKWSLVYTTDFGVCNAAASVAASATVITTSGFTANWAAVSGATGYRLDVSADNFSTFVTGFNDKSVTGTTQSVTGLVSGTAHKYRVRAVGATCTSINSNIIDVTTLVAAPVAPVAAAASVVGETGFTATWNTVAGATGYRLDVSTNDFVSKIAGYDNKAVAGTSEILTGLSASTTYKYRVRAENSGGASSNSNVITATTSAPTTAPAPPVANAASLVTQTGFTANWSAVSGASGYKLDVSADNFTTMITGYADKLVTGTTSTVSGLTAGTSYKYRLRAINVVGPSANSNVIDVTTLIPPGPVAPVATAATLTTTTGFTANWNSVSGATGYKLDISADNFVTFLSGYSDKAVTSTSEVVAALSASTAYKYRVRATDANGTSVSSNVIDVTTLAKQDQTITFAVIADKTVGDAAFTLSPTSSSGLAVTLTTTADEITLSPNNSVTLVKAGKATITASQAGDNSFNAATQLSREFCVNPARPVITITGSLTETPTLSSSATAGNQWYKDGVSISSAINQTLTVTTAGVYTVQATIEACPSLVSANFPVVVTEVTSLASGTALVLTPNPAEDQMLIRLPGSGRKDVAIYHVNGKVMQTFATEKNEQEVSVKAYAQGFYMVRVRTIDGNYVGRFVKK